MRRIYEEARVVEIYVGEAADNSKRLPTRFNGMKIISEPYGGPVPLYTETTSSNRNA